MPTLSQTIARVEALDQLQDPATARAILSELCEFFQNDSDDWMAAFARDFENHPTAVTTNYPHIVKSCVKLALGCVMAKRRPNEQTEAVAIGAAARSL